MKIDRAEEIINNIYQERMGQMEEETNEGLIIHLGTKIKLTKEEEASVIILRELQILRRKLENSIPKSLIKEKIEEIEEKMKYEENEKVLVWLHKQKQVLEELLKGE